MLHLLLVNVKISPPKNLKMDEKVGWKFVNFDLTEQHVEKVDPLLTGGRTGELCGHWGDGHVLLAPGQQVDRHVPEGVLDGVDAEKRN